MRNMKKGQMRFSAYLLLLFSFVMVFFIAGFHPIDQTLYNIAGFKNNMTHSQTLTDCDQSTTGVFNSSSTCNTVVNTPGDIQNSLMTNTLWALAGVLGLASLATGFGAIYVIPMGILIAINVYILPIAGIINNTAIPLLFQIPLVALFNLLMVGAYINFIRGGT